ncbi:MULTISPECIES: DUF2752 domain-containing protein [Streptomycetaceae]|uniref:DUF2752 domain-containing protein n=1 Tax=Streptantibioticus cattleyicolor (strain ATCC 35852 / DSM 46488 / JCM 4925 / NBRC 14057 / NRRL 8057) TaxID=1003195 RepID=F8JZU6_STREN|nr:MULTISPECIES: DUF2752 domain-containing protein [Streptomycetaceae]AEW93529.1 hypothetical protein SCATT_11580 [Streptantibioticus cattleyicolor NRRL 8057 = DSM 46488]MYS58238.1 DUF2752 domain-containing protein [Streptomyces sp. SID5468]CCB73880.1 conserved membrane protein of unknown function [Streptantibioticus cattleyicolor NRRL 8057 = DSM 46488]
MARPTAPGTSPAPRRPDTGRWRRAAPPGAALGAVLAAFGYVAVVDPGRPGHYPGCPFRAATGWYCPACGGLRSAHAVAHGDLAAALRDNALAVLGYGAAAVLWVWWLCREVRARPGRTAARRHPGARRAATAAVAVVVIAFTVVRNTPAGRCLAP